MTGKEIVVPDWLVAMTESQPSNADQIIVSAVSVPRLSLKGKVFRFKEEGEEVRKEKDQIHIVILGAMPERGMAKTWYRGQYTGESDPPTCSSSDGVRPDSWVTEPQNETCATCQWNQWGSGTSMSGKKAKACRDSKRLYIVDPKEQDATIYLLNVTVMSLKNLSAYGKVLATNNIPLAAAITTVTFDEESEFPQLIFTFAGIMKEEKAKHFLTRATQKEWEDFSGPALSHDSSGAPQVEHKPEPAPVATPAAQPTPVVEQAQPAPAVETPIVAATVVEGEIVTKAEPESIDDLLNQW